MERKKLSQWDTTKEYSKIPYFAKLVLNIDLEGDWEMSTGFTSTTIHFKKNGKNQYKIFLETSGCLEDFQLERTATFDNGIIVLDKPVEHYEPLIYRKLYVVFNQGNEYLIPSQNLEKWEMSGKDSNYFNYGTVFRRGNEDKEDKRAGHFKGDRLGL